MKQDSSRLLPPLSMLRCFEAAARLGSFSRAADQLGLTQSAVSRQIAALEQWLDTPLFDRHGRRVAVNATGRSYRDAIAPALATIRRATAPLLTRHEEAIIELAVLPSFGMRWLAPRLPRLTERHSSLVVNISARSDVFEFSEENFDAAINVGAADWPGVHHDLLFGETVVPVVSPELVQRYGLKEPRDLLQLPLLVQSTRTDAWHRWFALSGISLPERLVQPSISHFLMLAQAVSAGAGAALMPSFMIEPELRSGALVTPIDLPLNEGRNYYLVYPEKRLENARFARFRNWMCDEARRHTAAEDTGLNEG